MIIADSVESLRRRDFYIDRNPDYPVTLLNIPALEPEGPPEPILPVELMDQLKGKVGEDADAQSLIVKLEQAARVGGFAASSSKPLPVAPPPPPPPMPSLQQVSYQEREVARFLREVEQKRAEEQNLLDKIVKELFEKVDTLKLEGNQAAFLKYAALDKLRMVEQQKQAIPNLMKVRDSMTPAMIELAHADVNPAKAMQDWISLLVQSERERAREFAQLERQPLLALFNTEMERQNYQSLLMEHLRQQIKKFESPN